MHAILDDIVLEGSSIRHLCKAKIASFYACASYYWLPLQMKDTFNTYFAGRSPLADHSGLSVSCAHD